MASCENQVERLGGTFWKSDMFFHLEKCASSFQQGLESGAGQTDTGRTTRLVVATLSRVSATAREMGVATMCTNHLENVSIIQLTWGKQKLIPVCHVNL